MDEVAIRSRLALKERELDLVRAIDHVRDTMPEPGAMLTAIANVLADCFQADFCLLCLLDRQTRELALRAVIERVDSSHSLEVSELRDWAAKVLELDDVALWRGRDLFTSDVSEAMDPQYDLHVAAVPIVMGAKEQLGAVLIARAAPPFTEEDVVLLRTAESQIDSAVIQGYAYHDLEQRNKELETIYRVDRIRDQRLPFNDMLTAVLDEVLSVIQAEMGFIMLYNQVECRLELRATTDEDLFSIGFYSTLIERVANHALEEAQMVCRNDLEEGIRSILCIPLILHNEIIGVLGVVNSYRPGGFASDDCRLLSAIGSQMDTAIFESRERRRLRRVLGRSVDPQVLERLLTRPDVDFLKGERLVLSVLYADLRDSTQLAESTDPELLVGFVNDYLGRMTEVILSHQGTLDKFIGDEVMALFGAPFPHTDHAYRAVRVALEMQAAHQELMAMWEVKGLRPSPMGIGIATGEMTVGEMGCSRRTDYTVIGRAANLGSRICSVAQGGEVLISDETYALVRPQVEAIPVTGVRLKGLRPDLTFYRIVPSRE